MAAVHVLPQFWDDIASTSVLLRDMISQSVPVCASISGAGFPIQVPGEVLCSLCTSSTADQVAPWSPERFSTMSMAPLSAAEGPQLTCASENTSSSPVGVCSSRGKKYHV